MRASAPPTIISFSPHNNNGVLLSFQELNVFQDSLQTLKIAKSKFAGSKDALEQIGGDWQDKRILVPLTGSMYVPGVVKSVDNFIIDIGTGYYVEKVGSRGWQSPDESAPIVYNLYSLLFQDLDTSKDYFKRKTDYVQEQMDKIDMLGLQKSKVLNAVIDVIEMKVAAMQAQMAATSK